MLYLNVLTGKISEAISVCFWFVTWLMSALMPICRCILLQKKTFRYLYVQVSQAQKIENPAFCGNAWQGSWKITFVQCWQFLSQMNTNSLSQNAAHLYQINERM
jgi:hypothetical protein